MTSFQRAYKSLKDLRALQTELRNNAALTITVVGAPVNIPAARLARCIEVIQNSLDEIAAAVSRDRGTYDGDPPPPLETDFRGCWTGRAEPATTEGGEPES
jgi:hypothetical protein